VGYEGVLVTFFDPFLGVRFYGEKVIPRLKQFGPARVVAVAIRRTACAHDLASHTQMVAAI
jgi:hypothetical protein